MKQSPGTERDSSFVVAWTDFTNGESDTDILAQLFDRSARVGGNMTLGSAPVGTTQRFPDVARDGLRRNGIYVSWDDDRNISREGWSIWGRIHEWNRGSSGVADAMSMDANNVHIYPNPVAQDAFFSFTLSEPAPVSLRLFTVAGEEVAVIDQGTLRAGEHSIRWNAGRMPIGVYLYRLRIGSEISTGCVVLAAN
jgi:hypothetical protein